MVKNKKEKSNLKRADQLIEEALRSLDKSDDSEEVELKSQGERSPNNPRNSFSEPIAKIDLQQYVDKEIYLRLAADFENFRKRAVKERTDAERSGREKILRGFLEVFDNLERGLAQVKGDESPLADGIRIILSQVEIWLKSEGLERIESLGKVFDPTVHEAISQAESDQPAGIIIEEIKRGYKWSSRLLRAATVVVSAGGIVLLNPESKNSEAE